MLLLAPWSRHPTSQALRLLAVAADWVAQPRNPTRRRGNNTWLRPEVLEELVEQFVRAYENKRQEALKDALAVVSREVLTPFFRELRSPTPVDDADVDRQVLWLLQREGLDFILGDDPCDRIAKARYRKPWSQYLAGKNQDLADQFCRSLLTGASASSSTLKHQRRDMKEDPARWHFARSMWANSSIESVSSAYHVCVVAQELISLLKPEVEANIVDATIRSRQRIGVSRAKLTVDSNGPSTAADSSAVGGPDSAPPPKSDPQSIPEIAET